MHASHETAAEVDDEFAELVDRLGRLLDDGDFSGVSALVAAHPAHAERLKRLLPAMAALGELDASAASGGGDALWGAAGQPSSPSRILGDFRILRELGRGGMGVVYEAEQISLGRRVALKVLPFAAMLDKQQLKRFKNEARAAATLDHPNIVAVHSVGEERGVHYYAMQLVEGESLAEVIARLRNAECGMRNEVPNAPRPATPTFGRDAKVLRSGARPADQLQTADRGLRIEEEANSTPNRPSEVRNPQSAVVAAASARPDAAGALQSDIPTAARALTTLPDRNSREHFRTIARLGIQAAEALDHAHKNGILHRDVKPGNLMVDGDGKLWVTDFGLARLESDASLTMTGDLLGTLRYMSPEQALGQRGIIDHRSDVYSLGATLYELLALAPPFAGDDRHELLRRIAIDEPAPPRKLDPSIPGDLETIVLQALSKEPADRYATAQDLADDLRRFLDARPIAARRPSLVDRARKWSRRHAALAAGGATLFLLLAAIGGAAALFTARAYRAEVHQRQQAEANLLLAAESIDRMLSRVASDARVAGDMQKAETLAADAAEFYERLLARSDHPQLAYQAAGAYEQIAVIWTLIEQFEKSARAHRRAKELLAPLAVPSGRAEHQAAMATTYMREAEVVLSLRRLAEAEELELHALAIHEQLADQFPHHADYDLRVASSLTNLGGIVWQSGRLDEAEVYFARAAAIESALPDEIKSLPAYWGSRGAALTNWGMLVRDRGDHARALRMFEESIALLQRACASANTPPADHACYRLGHLNIAMTHAEAGETAAAEAAVDRYLKACPSRLDAHLECAVLLLEYAKRVVESDQKRLHHSAIDLLDRARQTEVQTLQGRERMAWILANYEDATLRDPAEARRLAREVLAEAPEREAAWFTLAWAHYRLGDWSEAEETLENAVRHSAERYATAEDWLLLAMIRHQQGNHEESRRCLAKCRDSSASGRPLDAAAAALLVEAEELIRPEDAESTSLGASSIASGAAP